MTGPRWTIPVELVLAAANATGVAMLTRWTLQHGVYRPHAEVILNENGFIAEAVYELPKYPGRPQTQAVRLIAVPKENSIGGPA